jgi:hypothetical protein
MEGSAVDGDKVAVALAAGAVIEVAVAASQAACGLK